MICPLNASRPLSSAVPMMPSGLISEAAMAAGTKVFLLIVFQMRLASIGCCNFSSRCSTPASVFPVPVEWPRPQF